MSTFEVTKLDNGWLLKWRRFRMGEDQVNGREVYTDIELLISRIRELVS